MRSEWVSAETIDHILAAMMPANALAIEVSIETGLRIDDVLSLKTDLIRRTGRPYVRDSKTGKTHRVTIPSELRDRLLAQAGKIYVFEHRYDRRKHRTRQAVYKDMRIAAKAFERTGYCRAHVSPHSGRKIAAVRAYKRGGLAAAAALLNHDQGHPLVTLLYALADDADASALLAGGRKGRRTRGKTGKQDRQRRAPGGKIEGKPGTDPGADC
uniref:Tyr recombinase domain-containing protein n=1 Tax=uncultured prokaryote TaxID=198431 RepID=A0A0H5PXV3_9ZZZZ|nr:hypothetical protein [uncultured prokaryote]